MLSSPRMRRLIAFSAALAFLAAASLPAGAAPVASPKACCRGGAAMACCLPAPGCAMKSCPAGQREAAALPGLPPAVLAPVAAETPLSPSPETIRAASAPPEAAALPPPDQPPRG